MINLKILTESIKEHTSQNIEYLTENKIKIGETTCFIKHPVLKTEKQTVRFKNLRELLIILDVDGILKVKSKDTLKSIINRYTNIKIKNNGQME